MPTKKRNCKFPATQLNQIWVENTKSSSEKKKSDDRNSFDKKVPWKSKRLFIEFLFHKDYIVSAKVYP